MARCSTSTGTVTWSLVTTVADATSPSMPRAVPTWTIAGVAPGYSIDHTIWSQSRRKARSHSRLGSARTARSSRSTQTVPSFGSRSRSRERDVPQKAWVTRAACAFVSITIAACTAVDADKAGGGPGGPVVLRLATVDGPPTTVIADFIDQVDELSDGSVRIAVVPSVGHFDADAEREVVEEVAQGRADLGYAGSYVFDTMGVTSLQALTAPMLI